MQGNAVRWALALVAGAAMAVASINPAQAAPDPARLTFTTLGTNSGPIPRAARSEPASLVRYGDQTLLVDVGDGAAEQLAKVGVPIGQVHAIFISHLHFDHTGGLFAFLGLRYQGGNTAPLTIYGPPGTQRTVDSLMIAMQPGMSASGTIRPATADLTDKTVKVVELAEGSKIAIGKLSVTATVNTHFSNFAPGSAAAAQNVSLSYRFDAPDRSVLFTGDTGPSQNVEMLCKGADLLVSEIMDPVAELARIKKARPDIPAFAWPIVDAHFRKEHLTPNEVGLLAERCGAKALVLTHNAMDPDGLPPARAVIETHYKGPITFAEDLQSF